MNWLVSLFIAEPQITVGGYTDQTELLKRLRENPGGNDICWCCPNQWYLDNCEWPKLAKYKPNL